MVHDSGLRGHLHRAGVRVEKVIEEYMRTIRYNLPLIVAAIALTSVAVGPVQADMISNNYNDYGHAMNNGPYCAATSFANSFAFLQNKYPTLYPADSLTTTPGNPTDARDNIIAAQQLTGNGKQPNPPASIRTIWESKINYLEITAPNATIFEAQQAPSIDTTNWEMANVIQQVIPTPDFLLNQLKKGEDVEIGFTGIPANEADEANNTDSHMVTLTGIDTTNMTLTYLDPNNPTKDNSGNHPGLFTANYTINIDDYIDFKWDNKNNPPVDDVTVFQAYAESPNAAFLASPEPSTFVLAVIGLSGVWLLRQRRPVTVVC
jgi:hypothetical protein